MKLKIACIQLSPRLGDVSRNAAHASSIIARVFAKTSPDVVILPELALTGYNFTSPQHIQPFLEDYTQFAGANGTGAAHGTAFPSLSFAADVSRKFKCFTVIGYPESCGSRIYNSSAIMSPLGKPLFNYRKTFLYETDKVWGASENPAGFEAFSLNISRESYFDPKVQPKRITAAMGICMDLNPYEFEAPFMAFEFSQFVKNENVDLVLCPTAWLSSAAPCINKDSVSGALEAAFEPDSCEIAQSEPDYVFENDPTLLQQPEVQTQSSFVAHYAQTASDLVEYWIKRFLPLFTNVYTGVAHKKTTVVVCNRVGLETDVLYGGSSSIYQFDCSSAVGTSHADRNNGNVQWLGSLACGKEGVLVRDVEI